MDQISKERPSRRKNLGKINLEALLGNQINKPGRYIGRELGAQNKNWESAKVRWALTYPELYEVGASNLGHIILYSILNSIPGQLCDRSYLPDIDLSKKIRDSSNLLFAVESKYPLLAFDILGFSLSYELGATNILEMLDLAGIPLYSNERKDISLQNNDCIPLIFAGGPTATSNPEPYAAFFDFFALGDGEELLPEIGLVLAEGKAKKLKRSELLKDLSEIPGIYVPSLFKISKNGTSLEPINSYSPKQIIRRVANPIPFYGTGLVPNIETVHDRLTVEIRRGCTRGCRFCQPGMITRPARDVKPDEIIKAVENGMKKTGYSDFSLLSLSCSDYLALPAVGIELRNRLANKNISLQLPSQRIDRFNDDIAYILGGTRKGSLTFAPEAGTQRLRDIINKGLTDKDLIDGIRKAMKNKYQKVKLYFMIGLPGEKDEDVRGIASTCKLLQDNSMDLGHLKLNITISNFTPKPHTPFQWHSVSNKELCRRQDILRKAFQCLKGVKVNFTDIRISAMEDFIGRGDRRLAPVIKAAWEEGAGMDAWFESIDRTYNAWKKAINFFGLEGSYRELEMGSWNDISSLEKNDLLKLCSIPLPWDHIDTGVEKRWLAHDLLKALKEKVVDDCSFDSCSSCGVCGENLGHNSIVEPIDIPDKKIEYNPPSEKNCRIRLSFSKTGYLKYLGHLDIMRLIERAIRRSNLPISYTNGFHPLPQIKFALSLPLGVEGYSELMDIYFFKKLDPENTTKKLQQYLPQQLKIFNAKSIDVKSPSLSQELKSAVWIFELIPFKANVKSNLLWEEGMTEIINRDKLIWRDKDKKGRGRERDFKPLLKSLEIETLNSKKQQKESTDSVLIRLESLIENSGVSLKPAQIHFWLQEYLQHSIKITGIKRTELKLFQC